MSDDPKIDFYLANRSLIEEWAALRAPASGALDRALLAASRDLTGFEDFPDAEIRENRARSVILPITADPLPVVWLELWWEERTLLKGAGGWPNLCIVMNPQHPRPLRDSVKNATLSARETHGMASSSQWWLRYGPIAPRSEPIDIDGYAQHCVQRLRDAWLDLRGPIRACFQTE